MASVALFQQEPLRLTEGLEQSVRDREEAAVDVVAIPPPPMPRAQVGVARSDGLADLGRGAGRGGGLRDVDDRHEERLVDVAVGALNSRLRTNDPCFG